MEETPIAGNSQELPDFSSKPQEDKKLFHGIITKKQLLLWGGIALFFLCYTGGTYYFLFAHHDKEVTPARQIVAAPTISPTDTPTPLPTPTITPVVDPVSTWKTYTNNTYLIKFRYPEDTIRLLSPETSPDVEPYATKVYYMDSNRNDFLSIDVQDSKYIGQSDVESRTIVGLDLKAFATEKWNQNKSYKDPNCPERKQGELQTITYLNRTGYSFTLTGCWNDDRGFTMLPQEYTYIFTEHEGYKIIIAYPAADALLTQILGTLDFF